MYEKGYIYKKKGKLEIDMEEGEEMIVGPPMARWRAHLRQCVP